MTFTKQKHWRWSPCQHTNDGNEPDADFRWGGRSGKLFLERDADGSVFSGPSVSGNHMPRANEPGRAAGPRFGPSTSQAAGLVRRLRSRACRMGVPVWGGHMVWGAPAASSQCPWRFQLTAGLAQKRAAVARLKTPSVRVRFIPSPQEAM